MDPWGGLAYVNDDGRHQLMAENVILLARPGRVHWQRQAAACAGYLDEHDYALVGKAESHADALALVLNGVAKVVVAAADARDDSRLELLLKEAGGRFEVCRPNGRTADQGNRMGHHTEEIVTRMASHGASVSEIARYWELAEDRVRSIIDRVRRRR